MSKQTKRSCTEWGLSITGLLMKLNSEPARAAIERSGHTGRQNLGAVRDEVETKDFLMSCSGISVANKRNISRPFSLSS
jgi:hypothetical protein